MRGSDIAAHPFKALEHANPEGRPGEEGSPVSSLSLKASFILAHYDIAFQGKGTILLFFIFSFSFTTA